MINRKPLKLVTLLAGLPLLFGGCRDSSRDFGKRGKINGYNAVAFVDGNGRQITINSDNGSGYLYAQDRENDGRFDAVYLRNLPKGHPLEEYASLEKLEQAYQSIVNEQQANQQIMKGGSE